ncbi:hypothetical protein ACLIR7_09620 [Nitratireductor aquimarinus]
MVDFVWYFLGLVSGAAIVLAFFRSSNDKTEHEFESPVEDEDEWR